MPRTPIALLVDDPCPLIHLYRNVLVDVHHKPAITRDGRPLAAEIPNSFLEHFCDIAERRRIKGKFSIVPSPAGKGTVSGGIGGFDPALTRAWIETAKRRLGPLFDFSPEMITHHFALDLAGGGCFDQSESDWSQRQDRRTLIPYFCRALALLREAGIDATGFTSPWSFGKESEEEYVAAMAAAQTEICGREVSWYFLHLLFENPSSRPWVACRNGQTAVISIPATVDDWFWPSIEYGRTDDAFISGIADKLLSADGKSGQIVEVLDAGGWPIICSHWQCFFSNGTESGLRALDEVARRVELRLADRVQWMNCSEIVRQVMEA